MSSLKIEERFSVQAPVERIWRFLLDPEQIAPCLPGAELLQIENERTFHGQMKVKVGPVTVAYQGTIELTHVDKAGRRVQMVGKGKEKGGAGSAKMTMESHLEPQPDGTVAIAVTSDVELAGRIVRFGRGMIQSVSAQLFKQFAANVRQVLESEGGGAAAGEVAESAASETGETGATSEAGETGATSEAGESSETGAASETSASSATSEAGASSETGATSEESAKPAASAQAGPASDAGVAVREREDAVQAAPAATADAQDADRPAAPAAAEAAEPGNGAGRAAAPASEPGATAASAAPATPAPALASTPSAARVSEPAAPRAAQAPQARTGRELAPREAEPVRALPLLFRALWDVVTGFFKRLLGRSR